MYGVDYAQTFSPVLRLQSFRMILAVATTLKMKLHFFDLETAFLNGDLEESVDETTRRFQ